MSISVINRSSAACELIHSIHPQNILTVWNQLSDSEAKHVVAPRHCAYSGNCGISTVIPAKDVAILSYRDIIFCWNDECDFHCTQGNEAASDSSMVN